jgi:hypothetical protein
MQTRRLFAIVWRINAFLILGVGILATVVLSYAAFTLFKDATRTRHVDNVANAALGEIQKETAEIGSFEEIPGSEVLRAPLNVRQTYSLGSGTKEAGSTRNYLFFDPSSRSTYWLKPSMEGLILKAKSLPSSEEYGQKKPDTSVVVYLAVEQDSNGDERLTSADKKLIAVSDPKGKNYRVIVDSVDRLNEARLVRPDRLLILYSKGAKLNAMELNPQQLNAPVNTYELKTEAR